MMKAVNPRQAALDALYSIFYNDAYSNIAVDKCLSSVDKDNKAFVCALIYGVCEKKLTLEYIISDYIDKKPKPKVFLILLLGAYQLYFMDKVPSSAALDESVKLAKLVGCSYYSGFVNAVLHKIDNNRIDLNSVDRLSVRYSCPEQLINMWTKNYGIDSAQSILDSLLSKPPVFAIPNRKFVTAEELLYELNCCSIDAEPYGDVLKITSTFDLRSCKAFSDGLFYIEDYSSYLCAKSLMAKPGDTIFDMCSAPGGKSFTIACDMQDKGTLLSFDLHPHRVMLVSQGANRLSIECLKAEVNDALVFNPSLPQADKILCDVPCSGFGTIRRKPEIRYKSLDSVKDLPQTQYNILSVSSKYLKSGGIILYSTCTLSKKENEKVVRKFLDNNPEFLLLEENIAFPGENGDGFYRALFKKND